VTYTVSLKIIENLGGGAGQHAELSLDRLGQAEVAEATRRLAENTLAALALDRLLVQTDTDIYQDVVHQIELGDRANPTELVATCQILDRPPVMEFAHQTFFNAVRVRHGERGWITVNLPEPITTEAGDTLRVSVAPDGRTAVVQFDTEGAIQRLLATSLHLPPHTPQVDLIDRAIVGDLVLTEVSEFASNHGYPLREGKARDDVTAMLWRVHHQVNSFAEVVKFANRQGFAIGDDSLGADTRAMLDALSRRLWPAEVGEVSSDGVTWPSISNAGKTQLVLEPVEDGRETVGLSVYHDGDGPGVALSARQLREVAAHFLARADELDAAEVGWSDPHGQVKGTVSWPESHEEGKPHASVTCCGRIECIDAAADWVKKVTGHLGQWTVHAEKGQ
jgi:hypothetical protein